MVLLRGVQLNSLYRHRGVRRPSDEYVALPVTALGEVGDGGPRNNGGEQPAQDDKQQKKAKNKLIGNMMYLKYRY